MKETIIEKVVPFEIAKQLKILGYDEKINENYTYTHPWVAKGGIKVGGKYKDHYRSHVAYSNSEWETNMSEFAKVLRFDGKHPPIAAPSYNMVIDWLLEHHGYYVKIDMVGKDKFLYELVTFCIEEGLCHSDGKEYPTRYAAMDAAFKRVLRIISNNKKSEQVQELMDFIKNEIRNERKN